jgi:hypothetical protein
VAELIERILAALIVIVLLGIVLYLAMEGRVISVDRRPPPTPAAPGDIVVTKKDDRLVEATPSELRRDWSRSPTIVIREEAPPPPRIIREKAPPPRVIRETVRPTEYRREYHREHRTYRTRDDYRPVEYRDRTVSRTYRYYDDDCVGADCACVCDTPYWSNAGPICWD